MEGVAIYMDNKLVQSRLFEESSIPIRLRMDLLEVNISKYFMDKYSNFTKEVCLPNGRTCIINDGIKFIDTLENFFDVNCICKFMKYYLHLEISEEGKKILIEILPIVESA